MLPLFSCRKVGRLLMRSLIPCNCWERCKNRLCAQLEPGLAEHTVHTLQVHVRPSGCALCICNCVAEPLSPLLLAVSHLEAQPRGTMGFLPLWDSTGSDIQGTQAWAGRGGWWWHPHKLSFLWLGLCGPGLIVGRVDKARPLVLF